MPVFCSRSVQGWGNTCITSSNGLGAVDSKHEYRLHLRFFREIQFGPGHAFRMRISYIDEYLGQSSLLKLASGLGRWSVTGVLSTFWFGPCFSLAQLSPHPRRQKVDTS